VEDGKWRLRLRVGSGNRGAPEPWSQPTTALPRECRRPAGRAIVGEPACEAIVLAGGMGTRIRHVVPDRPKAMMDVAGRPFLEYLLDLMSRNGIARTVLATGHLHDSIQRHFGTGWRGMEICYSVEDTPLGTGGATWKALRLATRDDVFVFNGDTFFDIDLSVLRDFHLSLGADITLALKPMRDILRYGSVALKDGQIVGFREKSKTAEGLINGGIYVINRRLTGRMAFPETFSLESDLLEKMAGAITIGGSVQEGYFIDIGMPVDYARAQRELPLRPPGQALK